MAEAKKFYFLHTIFRRVKDNVKTYLDDKKIYYELSGDPSNWNFNVLLSPEELVEVNSFIATQSILGDTEDKK